jgi:hypothetical protein
LERTRLAAGWESCAPNESLFDKAEVDGKLEVR